MRRRERTAIYAEILEAIREEVELGTRRATAVARTCNLPYDRFRQYVTELQTKHLLDATDPFLLTLEGTRVLARYQAWRESVRLFGLESDD